MPTVKLRFPGGRYHATPWGHHVNEGLIEWPPSPWRLLRALIACGFSSQGWVEVPALARQLISKLAGELPSYRLPETSAAHSRHFMPIGELGKGREKTTLVFDTWANVGDGELLIHWPCELNGDEKALLARLAAGLGYLGRSESWVEAELAGNHQPESSDFNAFPHKDGSHPGREYEQVSLMAAILPGDYETWREQVTAPLLDAMKLPESSRKPTQRQLDKQREKLRLQQEQATAPYPPDLLSCLMKDTAWWKEHGWSQPPGSRRVLYWRRNDSLQVGVPPRPERRPRTPITTMLLALTTPSGSRSALPSCARTLPQAELFHRAIVGRLVNGNQVRCPELTGKDEHGKPLHDRHEHAHTIPMDLDGDGRLDHILIYSKMGLTDAAQQAIRNLRRTWTKGGVGEIQVALVGHGELEILRKLPPPLVHQIERLLGPPAGSKVWEGITPFVPPRHIKPRGKNTLLGQINAELASRGFPAVEAISLESGQLTRALRHYIRRRRRNDVQPPIDIGFGLRLYFSEPIRGPIMLGYASHYGLGMFHAVPS